MSYFLLAFLMISPAFSALEKIEIKNLDFNYALPEGSGVLEKISVGVSIVDNKQNYPVSLFRRETSFDLVSSFIDFQWLNPIAFVHNMKAASGEQLSLKLGTAEHYAKGEWLKFTPEKTGEFFFRQFNLNCLGSSQQANIMDRIKADCLENMIVSVIKMDLPFEFLNDIADQLPDIPSETGEDIPATDFFLSVHKGDFQSHVRIKYLVRAFLRMWGHARLENEGRTLAIRMDLVKYGIVPVTNLVLNELRRQIKHPNVTINPPWIRITQ